MYNNTGVTKTSYLNKNQILFAVEHQVSMSIVVDDANITAGSNGKKIVKAGTPLTGSLDARTTAFTKASSSGSPSTSNAVGILLHDVDVTAGENNGTLLIFGFVNTNRIDATTKVLITAEVKAALPMIKFVAC